MSGFLFPLVMMMMMFRARLSSTRHPLLYRPKHKIKKGSLCCYTVRLLSGGGGVKFPFRRRATPTNVCR